MTWLRAIPLWAWTLACGLLVGAAFGWWVNGARWEARLAVAQKGYAEERQGLAGRAQEAEAKQRAVEQSRQKAVDEAVENGQQQTEKALADADSVRTERDRLQQQFEASERRSRACGNSLTAAHSEAADRAARVRADVFGRCTAAVGLYAGIADERGIAGATCEAAYQSLR